MNTQKPQRPSPLESRLFVSDAVVIGLAILGMMVLAYRSFGAQDGGRTLYLWVAACLVLGAVLLVLFLFRTRFASGDGMGPSWLASGAFSLATFVLSASLFFLVKWLSGSVLLAFLAFCALYWVSRRSAHRLLGPPSAA